MFTVDLIPSASLRSEIEYASLASTWLSTCIGVCAESEEQAIELAISSLEESSYKDALDLCIVKAEEIEL